MSYGWLHLPVRIDSLICFFYTPVLIPDKTNGDKMKSLYLFTKNEQNSATTRYYFMFTL